MTADLGLCRYGHAFDCLGASGYRRCLTCERGYAERRRRRLGMKTFRKATLRERFWPKVDRAGGPQSCWHWLAARLPKGYGLIGGIVGRSRNSLAHRVSFELAYGPIPAGMCVLHKCDNPPCVNPLHLFLGSITDNNRDTCAKGRIGREEKTGRLKSVMRAGALSVV